MRTLFTIALGVISATLIATQAAACEPELQVGGTATVINYDGFDGAQRIEDVPVRIVNNGRTACVGRLLIGMDTLPRAMVNANGDQIQFEIIGRGGSNPIVFDPATNRSEPIAIRVPPGRTEDAPVRLRIFANQRVRAGSYAAVLDFMLEPGPRAGNPGQGDPVNWTAIDRPVTLTAIVAPRVQANFTGVDAVSANGQNGSINLGELSTGQTRQLGIQVRANVDVDISVRSLSRGALVHRDDERARIPYSLAIQGTPVDLSQETVLPGQASLTGVTNGISLRVGSTNGARSGTYVDQIIFTIAGR
jgi:hypothetical protein